MLTAFPQLFRRCSGRCFWGSVSRRRPHKWPQ